MIKFEDVKDFVSFHAQYLDAKKLFFISLECVKKEYLTVIFLLSSHSKNYERYSASKQTGIF